MPQTFPVSNPPNTLVKSSHGIQIKVGGDTIGAISKFTPAASSRAMTRVWELNPMSSGHPIDTIPGNLDGFTLDVERYDLWRANFEEVFGGEARLIDAIGNQKNPFEVYQYLWHPDGFKELTVYRGCWFSNVGRDYSSTADRIIMVRGQLNFLRRDKVI